jgi:hypothetical protein
MSLSHCFWVKMALDGRWHGGCNSKLTDTYPKSDAASAARDPLAKAVSGGVILLPSASKALEPLQFRTRPAADPEA